MVIRTPSSLRSLERRFAKERAEVAVNRFVLCLLTRWDEFMDAEMDAVAIIRKLRIDPNSMDTWGRTIVYISRCISEGRPPDHSDLVAKLAPWIRIYP